MKSNPRYLLLTALAYACGDGTAPKEPSDAIKIAVGEVRAIDPANAATLHVSGDAGAEYTLIASYTPQNAVPLGLQVSAEGITTVVGPPTPRQIPFREWPVFDRAGGTATSSVARPFRTLESEQLSRYVPAARARYAARTAISASVDPPVIGSEMQLNVSLVDCGPPQLRTGRVVTVSDHAIIVEDETNPSGGFSGADYDSIIQEFETLVYPMLIENFGTPTDVDSNGGRIVFFFTVAVNQLTPPGSSGYIASFSYPRDLVPKTGAGSCAGSNEAELIYLMVPDPTGIASDAPHSIADVRAIVPRSLAHQGQTLINDGRRLLVTHTPFEQPWLKEALSDIAEELLFYRAAGVHSKQNFTLASLRASTTVENAVNKYQIDNLGRFLYYLRAPESSSPTSNDATIENSGAAWAFLRYIADHNSIEEATLWHKLVDAPTTGIENLTASAGVNVVAIEHQWAAAQYADDAGFPVDATLQQPSWNFRDLMPALDPGGAFPLATHALTAASPIAITLGSGGTSYVRFAVPASTTATIHLTSGATAGIPTTLSLMLLRTK